jgi:hypothetical protein
MKKIIIKDENIENVVKINKFAVINVMESESELVRITITDKKVMIGAKNDNYTINLK